MNFEPIYDGAIVTCSELVWQLGRSQPRHFLNLLASQDGRSGVAPAAEIKRATMECAAVIPQYLQDAYEAETIFLAVPFSAHKDVAKQFKQWNGKIVVDVTNAFHVAPVAGKLWPDD